MTLLRELPFPGYPTPYLLSRLRARSARLTRDWQAALRQGAPAGASEEELWRDLLKEHAWVYRQLNTRLRRRFAPAFCFFEIRTLVLALRNRKAREAGRVEEVLEQSLLDGRLLKPLRSIGSFQAAMTGLARQLAREAPDFAPLLAYAEQGELRPFENALAGAMLAHATHGCRHPLVRFFIASQIDLRNLFALAKHQRWQLEEIPELLPGGQLPHTRMTALIRAGRLETLERLVQRTLGPAIQLADPRLEIALLRRLSEKIRRQARDYEEAGPVLDYLWRRTLETRNLGVLLSGRDLPEETLAAELIA
ncbi:hypothetical protein DESUT3_17980 [Desulfuromonas versatilis]|uniref:Uncharacterized protein n=1 Tax=Desulfuromonas versatilis TaxID=2802975 RepID=A0ABN6DZU6_9BACT|nr:V-type ATPase subunit [Desulfuromonas versatilis]BCR04729.1 hypothetical protein DESUT3_17980 [Desulfuromonas versatilis]